MDTNISYREIEEYWHRNTISYTIFTENTLHYGIWDEDTKSSIEAHENTNKYIAKVLQLKDGDLVLDAGCGVGGVSIYIAENYDVHSTGISISAHQIELAKQNATFTPAVDNLEFHHQSYMNTEFEDESFHKLFGLESICYAKIKLDFLREAYRLLKPGGRILVQDAYILKTDLNKKEEKELRDFLVGWALPNLAIRDEFEKDLETAGFKEIEYFDKQNDIKKTIQTVYWNAFLAYPITWILSKLQWIPKTVHETAIGGIAQKRIIDMGVVTYGTFTAVKPDN